jgi:hypothetical protein
MENLVWIGLLLVFAAYLAGPGAAVLLLVGSALIVGLIVGCAALLDWREAHSKRRFRPRS